MKNAIAQRKISTSPEQTENETFNEIFQSRLSVQAHSVAGTLIALSL